MFTKEQFEAYRALGHAAGRRSIELLNAAPVLLGTAGRSNGQAQRPTGAPTP